MSKKQQDPTTFQIPEMEQEPQSMQRNFTEDEAKISHEVFRAISSFVHGYLNGNFWDQKEISSIINATLHGLTVTLCYYAIQGKLTSDQLNENIKLIFKGLEETVKEQQLRAQEQQSQQQ